LIDKIDGKEYQVKVDALEAAERKVKRDKILAESGIAFDRFNPEGLTE
jgi:hypothetical protein